MAALTKRPLFAASLAAFATAIAWTTFATGRIAFTLDTLKFTPAFLLVSVSCVLLLLDARRREGTRWCDGVTAFHVLLALHVLLTVLPSAFWSSGYDTLHLLSINVGLLVAALLASRIVTSRWAFRAVPVLWAVILAVASVGGVLEYFGVAFAGLNTKSDRVAGFFLYPTVFSGFLAMAIPAALGLLITARRAAFRVVAAVAVGLGLFALVVSESRASAGALAVAVVGGAVLWATVGESDRRARRIALTGAGALLVVGVAVVLAVPQLRDRAASVVTQRNPRWMPFTMALGMWTRSPRSVLFGNGLGSFKPLSYVLKPAGYRALVPDTGWDAVHNEYLELLVDGGIVSLAAFLTLCGAVLLRVWRSAGKRSAPRSARLLSLCFGVSALSFLLDVVFSTNSRISFMMLLFVFVLSLADVASGKVLADAGPGRSRVLRWLLTVRAHLRLWPAAALVLLIALNTGFVARFASEVCIALAARAAPGAVDPTRSDRLEQALWFDGRSVFAWFYLAQTSLQDRDLAEFERAAQEVDRRIPGFEDLAVMKAISDFGRGDYGLASSHLEGYLRLNSYDPLAESYLVIAYASAGRYGEAVRALQSAVRNDFGGLVDEFGAIDRDKKPVPVQVRFPEEGRSVRCYPEGSSLVVEFSTQSMTEIVTEIMRLPNPSYNTRLFRYHFVLGKVYESFGLLTHALRHFRIAREQSLYSIQAGAIPPPKAKPATTSPEGNEETPAAADQVLAETLAGLVAQSRSISDARAERQYLGEFLSYYTNPEARGRYSQLCSEAGKWKSLASLRLRERTPAAR